MKTLFKILLWIVGIVILIMVIGAITATYQAKNSTNSTSINVATNYEGFTYNELHEQCSRAKKIYNSNPSAVNEVVVNDICKKALDMK